MYWYVQKLCKLSQADPLYELRIMDCPAPMMGISKYEMLAIVQ